MRFLLTDGGRRFSKRPEQTNDCTVRALATVCHVPYDAAYLELRKRAGRKSNAAGFFPTAEDRDAVLLGNSFVWSANLGSLSLVKFCNANADGRFVVDQPGHVAVVLNGILFDDQPWRLREPLDGWWTVTKIRT